MDFIAEELKDAKEIQRLSIPARRLKEKLTPIPSTFESLRRRWFWELLQNASDYNDKVSIVLDLYSDKIVFSHNGAPFKPIDTENLISPDSGKDDEDIKASDPIGQFGTGFISTHVLSSEITVSGIVASQKYEGQYTGVRFKLDRSRFEHKEDLIKSISDAESQLENETYQISYKTGQYNTHFSYNLNKPFPNVNSIETVNEGLKNINDLLPYTMIFMDKVIVVEIINHAFPMFEYPRRSVFFRGGETSANDCQIVYRPFDENDNALKTINYHFKIQKENDATVVVRVEEKKILSYPSQTTKLFCSLPMIGTENFCLPYILNSSKFIPATERHKVELSDNDTINRKILTDGIKAFKTLIDNLVEENYKKFYHLCRLVEPGDSSLSVNNWLKDQVLKSIQSNLLNQDIVNIDNEHGMLKLSETKVAFLPRDEFSADRFESIANIVNILQKKHVPKAVDVISWYNTLDFVRFGNLKFTIEMTLKEINDCGSLKSLEARLGIIPTSWLTNVHEYVLSYHDEYFDQYKIIPDQEGNFHYRKDEINWDDDIPEELKIIYLKLVGASYGRFLLDVNYEINTTLLPTAKKKSRVDIGRDIDTAFKNYSGDTTNKGYLEALRKLFLWFKNHLEDDDENLKTTFEWFSKKKPQLFMDTFNEEEKDKAFAIVQSGKLQSLAKLAESSISEDEIDLLTNNLDKVKSILEWLSQKTDDKTYADENTGNTGEEIVFEELNKKFGAFNNTQVVWASRDRNEARYDFEIIRNGNIILYIDAKTTNQGIANSDSIPFFVRRRQWEFLKDQNVRDKYIAARVTVSIHGISIEWLSLKLMNIVESTQFNS